jgi:hypothetical protein
MHKLLGIVTDTHTEAYDPMPSNKRVDWAAQLKAIRDRMWNEPVPKDALVCDVIADSQWAMALTEYDLRFLKTLRIEA